MTYATRYKRCLLIRTPNGCPTGDGLILYRTSDGEAMAFWNKSLKGYVVRPTKENVKEVCDWLEVTNACA